MTRTGGYSYNMNRGADGTAKKGIITRFQCPKCGRVYKQQWTMRRHANNCSGIIRKRRRR